MAWWSSTDGWEVAGKGVTTIDMEYDDEDDHDEMITMKMIMMTDDHDEDDHDD